MHALDRRTDIVPQDRPSLVHTDRHVIHRLARHDLAIGDLLAGPVGYHGDVEALGDQADAQMQAGLTGTDDGDLAHVVSLRFALLGIPFRRRVNAMCGKRTMRTIQCLQAMFIYCRKMKRV
jgi:hypothetical protein